MKKSFHISSFHITVLIGILAIAVIVALFLLPDMSSKSITTVPEYPPELSTIDTNESLITNALVINRENAKSIIEALHRPSEYYSETESVISHNGGSSTFFRKKWVKGDYSRVDIISNSDRATMHYVYTKEKVYIYSPSSRTYYTTAKGDFDADSTQMLVTYEDIIKTPDDDILDAKLATLDGSSCIWVETKNQSTGNTTRYWVATSTGLLLYAETVDSNGNTVYTLTTKNTELSPQSEDIFKLPDGSFPT